MKLLIDTNVILDMVFRRNVCDDSMKLFRKSRDNGDRGIRLFGSWKLAEHKESKILSIMKEWDAKAVKS